MAANAGILFNDPEGLPSHLLPADTQRPMNAVLDRQTFDRLVLEHLSAAQRFSIRLAGDPAHAEELMQQALLKAHRGWQGFRGEARFRTWLFQIIVNCFRDSLAARSGHEPLPDDLRDAHAPEPAGEAEAKELGELVAAEVSRLPPRQREVLVLIVYEQLSIAEVAGVLHLNEQNVRTNLHLARQRLRQRLKSYLKLSGNSAT